MKINWNGEESINKDDVEVLRECIKCQNVNICAEELNQGEILCFSLYAKFTDNKLIKDEFEEMINEDNNE